MVGLKGKNKSNRTWGNPLVDLQVDLVNLDTRVRTLQKRIDKMEDKQINEWKVVKIVFAILSALGVIIGMIFAILNYVIN